MDDSLFSAAYGVAWIAALIAAPAAGYIGLYLVLRCWGKLRVNASGWHAAGFGLFRLYQPLLCAESALVRKIAGLAGSTPAEQPVSEVVVELIVL